MKTIDKTHKLFLEILLEKTRKEKYKWVMTGNSGLKYQTEITTGPAKKVVIFSKGCGCDTDSYFLELLDNNKLVYCVKWNSEDLISEDRILLDGLYEIVAQNDHLKDFLCVLLK